MTWDDLKHITNRAFRLTLDYKKMLLTFCALVLVGIVLVACRVIAGGSGGWASVSLMFLPLFFGAAVLMAVGVILVRLYHDQVKDRPVDHKQVLMNSWQLMVAASYFAVPVILLFLLLWMALAVFYLFTEIPYLGKIFTVILIFLPYLLNLALLVLVVASVAMLFFVTPLVGLRGLSRVKVAQVVGERFRADPFSNVIQLLIALLPLAFSVILLLLAGCLTTSMGFDGSHSAQIALQWFFIMIPFVALVSPGVVFFFNLAVEAHVLTQSYLKKASS